MDSFNKHGGISPVDQGSWVPSESPVDFPWGPCGLDWWLSEPVPQAKVAEALKGEAACPALLFPGIVSATMRPS